MRLFLALCTRSIGAVAVIVLVLTISRQYETAESGIILFLFASAQFLMGLSRGGSEVDLLEAARNRFEVDGFARLRATAIRSVRRSAGISFPVALSALAAFVTSDRSDGFLLTVLFFAMAIPPGALMLLELEVLRGIGNSSAATFLQTGAVQLLLLPVAWFGVGGASGFALSFVLVHVVSCFAVAWRLRTTLHAEQLSAGVMSSAHPATAIAPVAERGRGWVILVELLRISFLWAPLLALYWKGTASAILEFSVAGRIAAAVGVLVPAFLNFLAPSQVAKYADGSHISKRTMLFGVGALVSPALVLATVATLVPGRLVQLSGVGSLSASEFLKLLLALIGMQVLMGLASFFLQERLIGRYERRAATSLAVALTLVILLAAVYSPEFDSLAAAYVAALLQGAALFALALPKLTFTRSYAK